MAPSMIHSSAAPECAWSHGALARVARSFPPRRRSAQPAGPGIEPSASMWRRGSTATRLLAPFEPGVCTLRVTATTEAGTRDHAPNRAGISVSICYSNPPVVWPAAPARVGDR
jgi:hypothetical protein